jgi:hypothetical protein
MAFLPDGFWCEWASILEPFFARIIPNEHWKGGKRIAVRAKIESISRFGFFPAFVLASAC